MKKLLDTDRSFTSLGLRLAVGAIILPHGLQKLLGWFGGYGLEGTMRYFGETLHLPAALGALVIAAETAGAAALIAGLLTRVAAAGVLAVMVGAIALVHAPHGFFMNWFGAQAGEGFEFHLLVIVMSGVLVARGGGAYALDRLLAARRRAELVAAPAGL
jgi:putative oxidoreductase